MVAKYPLEFIKDDSSEFYEIKRALYSLPDDDPYKEELYKNILSMYEFINENNQDNKPKIRLLNNLESGKIKLSQLGYTSIQIQEIYSGAYGTKIGIQSNKGKMAELVKEQSNIIASVKAGSFIIEIDSIGDEYERKEIDIMEQRVDKFDLVNQIMDSINSIETEEDVLSYLNNYGHKTLVSTQKWFKELAKDDVEFEYINKKNNIKNIFDKSKVSEVYKAITDMKEFVMATELTIKGTLVGVINDNRKLFFKDINDEKITVEVQDDSLKEINVTTNKYYELSVKKLEKKSFEKIKVDYVIDTVYNSSLQNKIKFNS